MGKAMSANLFKKVPFWINFFLKKRLSPTDRRNQRMFLIIICKNPARQVAVAEALAVKQWTRDYYCYCLCCLQIAAP